MWPWIKRFSDWARRKAWRRNSVRHDHERARVSIRDRPPLITLGPTDLEKQHISSGQDASNRAPLAHFTCEGGFEPPPKYEWTATTEEEMEDRLSRLFEKQPPSEG
jgi:hypothetical protein